MDDAIIKRQYKNKERILEILKKTPIVQIACERAGVSRASYYRWRKQDPDFAKTSDQALLNGSLLVNDMAESQLMSAIKDKNMTAIIFWLKHHHPVYSPKTEISANKKNDLTEKNINHLFELLYNKNTFREGQKLLTSYVFKGLIDEKFAQLALRMFISQMRAEDIFTRKAEAELMSEVMLRKEKIKKR